MLLWLFFVSLWATAVLPIKARTCILHLAVYVGYYTSQCIVLYTYNQLRSQQEGANGSKQIQLGTLDPLL